METKSYGLKTSDEQSSQDDHSDGSVWFGAFCPFLLVLNFCFPHKKKKRDFVLKMCCIRHRCPGVTSQSHPDDSNPM